MKNKDLKEKYDEIFKSNKKFFTFGNKNEREGILNMCEWYNENVLEIGCGEGELAHQISLKFPKKIIAIDYSKEAIKIAKDKYFSERLDFIEADYRDIKGKFDIIIMQGVLEHLDNPFVELKNIIDNNLNEDGLIITSSPSFLNLRGYIWMTLKLLFDIPMSLTDISYFCPFDFEEFCKKNNYKLEYKSVDQDWGAGNRLLIDYNKRLRNALKDKGIEGDVDKLLSWVEKAIKYQKYDKHTGATVIYKIRRRG